MSPADIIDALRQERVGLTHAAELNELERMLTEKAKSQPTPAIRQTAATQRPVETLSRGFDLLLQVVSGKPVRKTTLTNAINRAKEAQKALKL